MWTPVVSAGIGAAVTDGCGSLRGRDVVGDWQRLRYGGARVNATLLCG